MLKTNIDDLGILYAAELKKSVNEHSGCSVSFYIKEQNDNYYAKYSKYVGETLEVENTERLIFVGIITNVKISKAFAALIVTVEASSKSIECDKNKKSRIFQLTEKTYKDILKNIEEGNKHYQIGSDFSEKKAVNTVIQNNETDFSFLKKLAKKLDLKVFVNDTNKNDITICIDENLNSKEQSIAEENVITIDYEISEASEMINCQTNSFIDLGTTVDYRGFSYVVEKVDVKKNNDIEEYHYAFRRRLLKDKKEEFSNEIVPLGRGKVVNNDDPEKLGRIQVEYLDFEDSLDGNREWISYINTFTDKNEGIVLIPGQDEIVECIYVKGKCIAIGCNREVKYGKKCENANARVIASNGVLVELLNDRLKIKNKAFEILVDEEKFNVKGKAELDISNGNITLSAKRVDVK